MELLLVTSAFCAACARTRETLTEAVRLVPAVGLGEIDVARSPDEAEALDIRVTPTVLLRDDAGVEVFRAEGVPTLPQVLTVIAHALPDRA
jgi:protein-disulfide isomerase